MERLKVMTVVGTRPEIIRLACVIKALEKSPAIEHVLVHTGQNYDYELNEVFFRDLGLRRPDFFLNAAGGNATVTAGKILEAIDPVLEQAKPGAFLVLGDTNSCLCAIAAKKRHIPIFHMEAGNRCFDQRVPEESNRKIVDHISDVNLCYSSIAREYLLREGLPPDQVIKTGSPMLEVLTGQLPKVKRSTAAALKRNGVAKGRYFVVSAHREENIADEAHFLALVDCLNSIAAAFGMPLVVTTHPRTRKMIDAKGVKFDPLVKLMKPMGLTEYLALQMNAKAVLSDSGTISEESSILGFRAVNLREAHERPEAMEEAAVMMTGLNKDRILQALAHLDAAGAGAHAAPLGGRRNLTRAVADYSMPNVGEKVVRIIISYTDYIRRRVWRERV